jgi:prepilin peptidase CpaA
MTRSFHARESTAAFVVASLVVACVVLASRGTPLPACGWAAAFLLLAIQQDLTRMRIPNWLTLPSLLGALALGGVGAGAPGLLQALAGAGIALAIMFVPFAFRWLGAGDVKAGMVLGALWGPGVFPQAFWWMVVAGGLLAIALLAARGELAEMLRRWGHSAWTTFMTRRVTYFGPAEGATTGLPFAVAMGLGAAAYQVWGMPWS